MSTKPAPFYRVTPVVLERSQLCECRGCECGVRIPAGEVAYLLERSDDPDRGLAAEGDPTRPRAWIEAGTFCDEYGARDVADRLGWRL
jgi:hypothetical protein